MRVLVKSPFSIFSGYGQDGFGLIRALSRWGCDVYVQPVWVDTPIPRDLLPLFGKKLTPPFDLTINHWAPPSIELGETPRRATRLAIAWTMWEFMQGETGSAFTGFPVAKVRTMKERLRWFDLVLGYDPVSIQAMTPFCAEHTGRGLLQGGYPSGDWPKQERDWHGDRFGFIMHGALNGRKQPWLAIEAFNTLRAEHPDTFGKHATLSLHTSVGGIPAEIENIMPKVKVFQETFDHETLLDFYKYNHMLLAPSLGEGKNLPALEMLSTGGTVAATDVGGHAMWMRGDIAYPLAWTPAPIYEDKPRGPRGAQVAVQTLKDAMWSAYSNRAEAKAKGDLAASLIPQQCDWSVVVENLFRRCRDLVPHNGELIYNMAQDCKKYASPAMAKGGVVKHGDQTETGDSVPVAFR